MSHHRLYSPLATAFAVALATFGCFGSGDQLSQTSDERVAALQGAPLLDSGRHIAPDGEVFTYEKAMVNGQDVVLYRLGDKVFTQQELQAYEAAHPAPVIEQDLARAIQGAPAGQPMDVVVWMRDRSGGKMARELRQAREGEIQALEERAQQIQRSVRPAGRMSPEQEQRFVRDVSNGRDLLSEKQKAELKRIGERIEKVKGEIRAEVDRRLNAATAQERGQLDQRLAAVGGRVRGRITTQNAYEITMPAGRISELARDPMVARIMRVPEGKPELDNQATSLGLSSGFWGNGVEGGIWDMGVLDTGVEQDHPNLSHLQFLSNAGTTDGDGHGTCVAGIVASDNATYKGLAFGIETMLVGYAYEANLLSNADWMVSTAADDPEAINISFGFGTADDVDYSSLDQFFDGLIDDNSVLVSKSTGNGGIGDGTTTITHPASAYNLLAVANVYDNNTTTRADDVIWSSSSVGPTLNGRRKPDIAAPGQNTMSTNNDWDGGLGGSNPDFVNFGGTSSAAPHVGAGVILLTDLRSNDNPTANKAILLNTADAWTDNNTLGDTTDDGLTSGSEWNATYGWGYLDLWEAWFNGLDVFSSTVDDGVTPAGPDFKLYKGYMFAGEKATLVWNRHLTYNGASNPTVVENLSDLDLLVYNAGTGASMGTSFSGINNVEQVAVGASGDVVVKVDVFGTLDPDVGVESYSLATEEGFAQATPPSFSFTSTPPSNRCGLIFTLATSVRNNGTVASFNNNVTLTLPAGMSLVGGANPQNVGTIAAGGTAVASWTVTSPPCFFFPVVRTVTFSNSSSSYGESFTGSAAHNIILNP